MGFFRRWFSGKLPPDDVQVRRFAEIVKDAWRKTRKPKSATQSAQAGAEIRQRLLLLVHKVEAATGWPAAIVPREGVLMVHPKLYEEIRKQPDKDILEPVIDLCFPAPNAHQNCNESWPAAVAKYRLRTNSEEMLREKAIALTAFITSNLDVARMVYADMMHKEIELTDDQEMRVKLEEAACWYRTVDELAHRYIGQDRPLFMDYLEGELAFVLALEGALPDAICGTLAERTKEYGQYGQWFPKVEEPARGTLLWEVAKHVAAAFAESDRQQLPAKRNPFFLHTFGLAFMERLKEALLYELLTGHPPGQD